MATNNKKASELTSLTTAASSDLLIIVDVDDTTDASTGTTKNITAGNLLAAPPAIGGTTAAAVTGTTITGTTVAGGMLATAAEAVAGTATDHITTPAGVASAIAVTAREPDQGVALTAAASGSSGITVADNDNIDFGTGNFTLVWKGSLPDWTPSANATLMTKNEAVVGGFRLNIDTSGRADFLNFVAGDSHVSAANTFADGTVHEIVSVITAGTSVQHYFDGAASGAAVALSALTSSTGTSLYLSGIESTRTAGTVHHAYTFNRALTAAEVLDLYRNGIAWADKWGSQTSIITGNDSTFSGASNWANTGAVNAYDETTGGVLTITANAAGQYCDLPVANATTVAGKKYKLVYDAATLTATWTIKDFTRTQTIDTIDAQGTGIATEFTATTTGGLSIVAVADNSSVVLDNFLLYEIGATLALEPEGIQVDAWKDSSTNGLDAAYPTTGSSLTRKINTGHEILLSTTVVTLAADGEQTIYTVPTGSRCILTKAILIVGADAVSTDFTIGADGAETDWLGTQQCDNLDAENDVGIFMPVPNATAVLSKSYAAGTLIKFTVANHAGGATNTLMLFGILY